MKDAEPRAQAYHHGDLRAALIAEGVRLLGARGTSEISLREVARNVGVSATAVYRHFPDKEALIAAVAAEGLRRLGTEQRAAFAAARGGEGAFKATGVAYVRFALGNPALFRLMYAAAGAARRESDAAAFLRENAEKLAPPGVDPRIFALQAWSGAHGLAMLMLDGLLPADEATIEAVIGAPLDSLRS